MATARGGGALLVDGACGCGGELTVRVLVQPDELIVEGEAKSEVAASFRLSLSSRPHRPPRPAPVRSAAMAQVTDAEGAYPASLSSSRLAALTPLAPTSPAPLSLVRSSAHHQVSRRTPVHQGRTQLTRILLVAAT